MTEEQNTLPRYVPHAKAERLVAVTRLPLAAWSIVVGVLTGILREPGGTFAVALLAAWGVFAVALWMRTRAGRPMSPAFSAAVPLFDLLVIVIVIISSGGALSPYFPLLVLPFFAVSLLYGRRAIAWTGVVGITAYLIVSFATPQRFANPRLFIMRIGFLLIIATGVLRRNEFDVRTRSDLLKLAAWPQPSGLAPDDYIRAVLGHAADLLRTPRVLLAWEDLDGKGQLALWNEGELALLDPPPGGARSMVVPELASTAFLSRDAGAAAPEALRFHGHAFSGYRGALLAPGIVQRFAIRSVVSVCFNAEMVEGRLFFLDGHEIDSDALTLAEIAARLLGSALEQTNLSERLRRATATEERMRLSRNLHDTLLQSMAGLALDAEGARRVAVSTPGAEQGMAIVVEQLSEAQRTLRAFVDDLRPESFPRREPLRSRLDRISAVIGRRWRLDVSVDADERVTLSDAFASEVCNLVAESLTNAARHSGATRARAEVTSSEDGVRIEVEDDGHGFPFHGHFELADLVAQQRGPWSLKERVVSLHGAMTLDSSAGGSRIEIRLPLSL
jgi:signal transduction histidine kinase